MTDRLVIVGCGGFGREVFHIVTALNRAGGAWEVEGFIDDGPSADDLKRVAALGSTHLGDVDDLRLRRGPYNAVVAIGSNVARRRIAEAIEGPAIRFPVLVHPDATVCTDATLGHGTVIAAGARVSTNVALGRHVHVDQNVTVGHDAVIGDFARLNPQACVSGSVFVGPDALIGAAATVLQGLRVGDGATVGAAACVTRDVGAGLTVKGVPAR